MAAPTLESGVRAERWRARWTMRLLALVVTVDVVALLPLAAQWNLLRYMKRGIRVSHVTAALNDDIVRFVTTAHDIAFWLTAIMFLLWFYHAYRNLSLVGTGKSRTSAGGATIYWFIPVLNLYRPCVDVGEIWYRSEHRNAHEEPFGTATPGPVRLWWLTFVLSSLIGRYGQITAGSHKTLSGLLGMTALWIAFHLVQAASGILAIRVVARINHDQNAFTETPSMSGVSAEPVPDVA
jgi:Domain of unknown function (DUF4328)